LAARSGSSAALHRFIGHILLSVLSGNTCVLPTLLVTRGVLTSLKSADVCYESGHFLPPRKKLTDSNTFSENRRYHMYCPKQVRSLFKKPAGNFHNSKKELIGGHFI
jgi:hypothetical protein